MRLYTVHVRRHGPNPDPDRDLKVVEEGFCWPAFFFSILWALWNGLWLVGLALLAAQAVVGGAVAALGLDPLSQVAVFLGLALIIGMLANDFRRWTLSRHGFDEAAVVAGGDADAALRRFLQNAPNLAADPRL
jgi:hypothetical protein